MAILSLVYPTNLNLPTRVLCSFLQSIVIPFMQNLVAIVDGRLEATDTDHASCSPFVHCQGV